MKIIHNLSFSFCAWKDDGTYIRWSHTYEFYAKLYIPLSTFKGAVFSLICSLRALSTKEKRYSIHPLGPFPFYIWIKNPLEAVMAPCTVLPNKIKLQKKILCLLICLKFRGYFLEGFFSFWRTVLSDTLTRYCHYKVGNTKVFKKSYYVGCKELYLLSGSALESRNLSGNSSK